MAMSFELRSDRAMLDDRAPIRGDVWLADLGQTRGHEQSGRRPVLVVSDNDFNQGPAGLAVVLPITSTLRNIPLHVRLRPPEGGLKVDSRVLCDAIRSVSHDRLIRYWGTVSGIVMDSVDDKLRALLAL